MRFDGKTFNEARDGERLSTQLWLVRHFLRDGKWHTLPIIAGYAGGSVAGVSARIRDLRKPKFGGHTISRRHVAGGLWQYRMEVPQ